MPTVREEELEQEFGKYVELCVEGCGNEGSIFLCGEGKLCEACFSKLADIPEHEAFQEIGDQTRMKARAGLAFKREADGFS